MTLNLPSLDAASRQPRPNAKPPKREKKARTRIRRTPKTKRQREAIAAIRAYVFERDNGVCRCCGRMAAETMHEMLPRSRGGLVSRENSIAVCGDGVRGCHGKLQRYEIKVRLGSKRKGAEGFLAFRGGGICGFDSQERGSEPGSGRITMEWAK